MKKLGSIMDIQNIFHISEIVFRISRITISDI